MHANFILCLLETGPSEHLKARGWRSVISSQETLGPETKVAADDDFVGPDAYKVAVMVLVGAAILSVCL
jgi:hypothetical protein